jgi:hypothetical protein
MSQFRTNATSRLVRLMVATGRIADLLKVPPTSWCIIVNWSSGRVRQDDIRMRLNEFGGELRQRLIVVVGKAVFENEILPFYPTAFLHSLVNSRQGVFASSALVPKRRPRRRSASARTASGQVIEPPSRVMKSRRLITPPKAKKGHCLIN